MGPLEAYLGAGLFHLFGPSLFTLRLGLVLCFVLFLFVCTYLLTSLLYTRLAVCVLILLSLGSRAVLTQQLLAIGGYPETLLFGSLLFATRLVAHAFALLLQIFRFVNVYGAMLAMLVGVLLQGWRFGAT